MKPKIILQNKIECLRSKLNSTVNKYGLSDEKTIDLSHQLDKLINQFNESYQLKSKK